jgi:hypothetical protein
LPNRSAKTGKMMMTTMMTTTMTMMTMIGGVPAAEQASRRLRRHCG